MTTGNPVHTGVEDGPMGWTGFLGRAAEVPLLARLLGGRGRCLAGGGPFLVPARLPQRWQREVLSEAEQAVSTVELESLPI